MDLVRYVREKDEYEVSIFVSAINDFTFAHAQSLYKWHTKQIFFVFTCKYHSRPRHLF